MSARVFVDNLPPGTTEEALRALFTERGGAVLAVSITDDRRGDDAHGYAFVEMQTAEAAAAAIAALHGHAIHGVALHVGAARSPAPRRDAAR